MDQDNTDNLLIQIKKFNSYQCDKSELFKYIDINNIYLYNTTIYSNLEISENNKVFSSPTRQNGTITFKTDINEFMRLKEFLNKIKSHKIDKKFTEMKGNYRKEILEERNEEEIKALQIMLFNLYCLYRPEVKLYQSIQTGKANPGEFQSDRKNCLSATKRAKEIEISIKNGSLKSVESCITKKKVPMPKCIMNSTFIPKLKNSPIANRFNLDEHEESKLVFRKGIIFNTLKEIIIESLETHDIFASFRQGKESRSTFDFKMLQRLTGLYFFVKNNDLYLSDDKYSTTPRDFICKFLGINISAIKFNNFRSWNEDHKTVFPNPDLHIYTNKHIYKTKSDNSDELIEFDM